MLVFLKKYLYIYLDEELLDGRLLDLLNGELDLLRLDASVLVHSVIGAAARMSAATAAAFLFAATGATAGQDGQVVAKGGVRVRGTVTCTVGLSPAAAAVVVVCHR